MAPLQIYNPKTRIRYYWKSHLQSAMISKPSLIFPLLLCALLASLALYFSPGQSPHLRPQAQTATAVTLKSVSSILRANLSRIAIANDIVFAGDSVGALATWAYDAKKKKLEFRDVNRGKQPILPPENAVLHLEIGAGVVMLTKDGALSGYAVSEAGKIGSKATFEINKTTTWFTLITITSNTTASDGPTTFLAAIHNKSELCLYQPSQSIANPNPLTKLQCNSTAGSAYVHVAFDPMNNLLSVGDENKVVIFRLASNQGKASFSYLTEANLLKVEQKGFKSVFTNGTLLAVNDLWLFSFAIDVNSSSMRLVSSERTEKIIKSGQTTEIDAVFDAKLKKSLAVINSKDRVQAFTAANSKLTFVNDSKVIGQSENFALRDQSVLMAAVDTELQVLKLGDTAENDYLSLADSESINSNNHIKPVRSISFWNNTVVTASEGGKTNLKLWTYSPSSYGLNFADEKSVSFFSLLKSGYVKFLSTAMIPPASKSNANTSLHVAAVGADPFSLYIVPVTAQGKFGSVFRSKDSHSNNITSVFVSGDGKQIITSSMDSTIKVWLLTANHDEVEDNTTTIVTKNGPVKFGLQDKSGQYYAFAHSNTIFNNLVNITIWKSDNKHGLTKIAQNVPNEAHESNLTAFVLSRDEKYLISYSESGQLRLWRLQNWSMVDLMASLSLGVFDATIQITQANTLLLQTQAYFAEYYFDANGFLLLGRTPKVYPAGANSSLLVGSTWFSGGRDGAIRVYECSQ